MTIILLISLIVLQIIHIVLVVFKKESTTNQSLVSDELLEAIDIKFQTYYEELNQLVEFNAKYLHIDESLAAIKSEVNQLNQKLEVLAQPKKTIRKATTRAKKEE